jgi:hypothetical protein
LTPEFVADGKGKEVDKVFHVDGPVVLVWISANTDPKLDLFGYASRLII